jgi:DNA repair protein RadD
VTDLRPYQIEAVKRIDAAVAAGCRRLLVVAPTGSGKTILFAELVRRAVEQGQRALVMAHRRELISQASGKLYSAGIDHGILLSGFPPRPGEAVQVASVATLHARGIRSKSIDMPRADLVIVDEAHHVCARIYRQILDAYPDAVVIGLAATPCRGDGRGLGDSFEQLIEGPQVSALIEAGYLVGTQVFAPSRPDLTGVRMERGDYVERELAPRMDQQHLVGDLVAHWLRLAGRRPTALFASSVGHSVHTRDEFRRAGVLAEHIDGTTPVEERDAILAGLTSGRVEVVCNYGVLTEGWDAPAVSCVILARPTKHHGLFRQMIGRVLRPAPGKADAIVLDHAGATYEHGLIEDPVRWSLHADRRAELPTQRARAEHRQSALVDCPECHAIRLQGHPCSVCGWRPRPKPVAVEVADGELTAVDRNRRVVVVAKWSETERRRIQQMLAWIARERGYAPGWVAHKFKEKFGDWPPRGHVDPIPPDDATRAWVRSRAIAWARAQQKGAA